MASHTHSRSKAQKKNKLLNKQQFTTKFSHIVVKNNQYFGVKMKFNKFIAGLASISLLVGLSAVSANAVTTSSATGLFLNSTDYGFGDAAISSDGKYIYTFGVDVVGSFTNKNLVYKIDTTSFEIIDSYQLPDGFDGFTILISPANDYIYVGGYASSKIAKIKTSDMSLVSTLNMRSGEGQLLASTMSNDGLFGYFTSDSGKVVKVKLSGNMSRVSAIELISGGGGLYGITKNLAGTVGYFVDSSWNPSIAPTIHTVDLTGNMSEIKQSNLDVGDGYVPYLLSVNGTQGYYEVGFGGQVTIKEINLATHAISRTLVLPSAFVVSGLPTLSADKKYLVTTAWTEAENELVQVKISDLTVTSRKVLPAEQMQTWFTKTNPVTGAIYNFFAPNYDQSTMISPAGLQIADTFALPLSKPSKPQAVKAVYGPKEATFTWSDPSSYGGALITKYKYCFSACTKAASWKSVTVRKIVKTGLKKGSAGTLQVRAVNSVGDGVISTYKFKQAK